MGRTNLLKPLLLEEKKLVETVHVALRRHVVLLLRLHQVLNQTLHHRLLAVQHALKCLAHNLNLLLDALGLLCVV